MNYLDVPGKSIGPKQRKFIVSLAEMVHARFDDPVAVNIGVLLGCSMACIRTGLPNARIIGIDINFGRRMPGRKLMDWLRADFIQMDSRDAYKYIAFPIHFLFIDGGHTFDVAFSDMTNYGSKVVVGGVVAIHDMLLAGVGRAFSEWYDSMLWAEIIGSPVLGLRAFERVGVA